jgi:hypothetical protein
MPQSQNALAVSPKSFFQPLRIPLFRNLLIERPQVLSNSDSKQIRSVLHFQNLPVEFFQSARGGIVSNASQCSAIFPF